ncbi:MAG: Ldh family oxidoreductase [Acidiferrobacterales bacterium]|nr:Ldh family oxidoreductase [Acidiferrobacterales bacterium]
MKNNDVALSLEEVYQLSLDALTGCGARRANAQPVAKSIQDAEADGIRNVGLNYLSHYCEHLRCGKVDGDAEPAWQQTAPAVMVADAANGFAHSAFDQVYGEFLQMVRATGIGSLAIKNSYAAGVIGWYVEILADNGLISLAYANSPPAIAPWGGAKAFFGTNPLAFGVPRKSNPPMIIDQSSSVTAKVNVVQAAKSGEPIPDSWALDSNGNPTVDAKAGLAGSMAPAGGYKGVALAMIVDLLAGGLGGPNMSYCADTFGDTSGGPPGVGQFFIGIAPEYFGSEFGARAESMFAQMCVEPGVRLPGDRRHEHRIKAWSQGVSLPESLYRKLLDYAR